MPGIHLPCREIKVAREKWMTRLPELRIKADDTPVVHNVGIRGVDYLPLVWQGRT